MILSLQSFGWGKNGHRAVGYIAQQHLSKKALKNLRLIMGNETLAMASNYMDDIKSDRAYDHMSPWHYCTIPDGQTYAQAGTPDEGDAIATIERLIRELETKKFTDKDELFALRCLIHLIGDIHQPLHVGNGTDRGGNDIKIKWFGRSSNLHRVWDSEMIDGQQLSYTELAESIDFASNEQIEKWQSDDIVAWTDEAKALRKQVYDLPENLSIGYQYNYSNWATVEQRLLVAGIRLAGVLNRIYG
jgi:hypothetical protein